VEGFENYAVEGFEDYGRLFDWGNSTISEGPEGGLKICQRCRFELNTRLLVWRKLFRFRSFAVPRSRALNALTFAHTIRQEEMGRGDRLRSRKSRHSSGKRENEPAGSRFHRGSEPHEPGGGNSGPHFAIL
jgi:hypothetical protein